MKWNEFFKIYMDSYGIEHKGSYEDFSDAVLWNKTAFPMASLRYTIKQVLQFLRIIKNNIDACDCCSMKQPFHVKGCLLKKISEELERGST